MHQVIAVMITGLRMSHQILAPSKVPDGLLDHCPSSMRMQAPEVGLHTVHCMRNPSPGESSSCICLCAKGAQKLPFAGNPSVPPRLSVLQPFTNSFE